jgi:phosphate-selective porin OprO/OprP
MSRRRLWLSATALTALAWPLHAAAQDDVAARIQALEAQVQALSRQIGELKAQTAAAVPPTPIAATGSGAAAPKPQPSTTASIANGKPTLASADGRFSAGLHAVMQLDAARYFQDDSLPAGVTARDLNSGANFRRARLGVDGKVFGSFDYSLLIDVGGGGGAEDAGRIQDLWLQYAARPGVKIRIGAFAPPSGLADAASTNGSMFPERPAAADLARGLAGGDTRVGAGLIAGGERWLASGAITGPLVSSLSSGATAFNAPVFDEQLGYVVRLTGAPLKSADWMVHAGVNANVVLQPADAGPAAAVRYPVQLRERPELRVDGTRLVDTGAMDAAGARALGFELAFQKQNLLFQGEYFDLRVDRRHPAPGLSDPKFSGWYIEGGWVLTGETRKYNTGTAAFDAPPVSRPLDPSLDQWGAWELAARYATLDLDSNPDSALVANRVRGGEQAIWTVGVNWFPNPVIKFMVDYQNVSIERRNAAGLPLSQDYQAVNLRSQYAF